MQKRNKTENSKPELFAENKLIRASQNQKELLLDHFEENPDVLQLLNDRKTDIKTRNKMWISIAEKLNSLDRGRLKTASKWAKYWIDMQYKTKRRARGIINGQHVNRLPSETEERMLKVMKAYNVLEHWHERMAKYTDVIEGDDVIESLVDEEEDIVEGENITDVLQDSATNFLLETDDTNLVEQYEIQNGINEAELIEYEHISIPEEELTIPNDQIEKVQQEIINLEDFGDGLKIASSQLSDLAATIDLETFDLNVIQTINSVGLALSSLGTVLCNLATVLSVKQRE